MNLQEIAVWIRGSSFNDLREVTIALAERLYAHRTIAGGQTPLELYEPALAIAGVYVSVDLAIEVHDTTTAPGFALKKRGDPDEVGWSGQYQIVGSSMTMAGRKGAHQGAHRTSIKMLRKARDEIS